MSLNRIAQAGDTLHLFCPEKGFATVTLVCGDSVDIDLEYSMSSEPTIKVILKTNVLPGSEPTFSSPRSGDALNLALAVMRGEEQAALLLADEVQMRYLQGPGFVSRESLQREVDRLKALTEGLEARVVGQSELLSRRAEKS